MRGEPTSQQNERHDNESDNSTDEEAERQRELVFPSAKVLDQIEKPREAPSARSRVDWSGRCGGQVGGASVANRECAG